MSGHAELKLDVHEVTQPIGTFYSGSVDAYDLLGICKFDFRRISERGGYKEFLGFQRKLDTKRVAEIETYIKTGEAVFPTAIVLAVDERCAQIHLGDHNRRTLTLKEFSSPLEPNAKIEYADIASIIDGQHRLKAFDNVSELKFNLNVSIFVGADEATKAEIFSTVNLAQTKVNRSLVYDLFSLRAARSPEKTCHEIVVALDSMPESPFYEKIKRLGVATEGRFGETLSQATIVQGILPYVTNDPLNDRDAGKRFGFWDAVDAKEARIRIFRHFFVSNQDERILANLLNYFNAVRKTWPDAWINTGTGNILNRTNGFNGFIRFLRPVFRHLADAPVVISQEIYRSVLDRVNLSDADFNSDRYPPGTSGATRLYRELLQKSNIPEK
jgi:DGQHR domain-containing protein